MCVPHSFTFMARKGQHKIIVYTEVFIEVHMNVLKRLCRLLESFSRTRPDMPGQGVGIEKDERVPKRLRGDGQSRDVFALVKQYMSSECLSQPPLLVFPEAYIGGTERFFNQINSTQNVVQQALDSARGQELEALASAMESDFTQMGRAAKFYRSLLDESRPRIPYTRLGFVEAGPKADSGIADVRLGQRPPAPKPHCLQVRFHH